MRTAIDTLIAIPQSTILDADFIRECDDEVMQALLTVGNVQNANQFIDFYLGMSLNEFLTEMTE